MFGCREQGKGLAVIAMLLGLSASARAADERILYASVGDATRSPIGWVEFCPRPRTNAAGARRSHATS